MSAALPFLSQTPEESRRASVFLELRQELPDFWDATAYCLDRPYFAPAGSCRAHVHENRTMCGSPAWILLP